jgi:5-methyltetrahydrofolate--homocysteine methyltransferase
VNESLSLGISAKSILDHLVSGMNVIGQRFEDGEIFLPEVMLAAEAMVAGISLLEPSGATRTQCIERQGSHRNC